MKSMISGALPLGLATHAAAFLQILPGPRRRRRSRKQSALPHKNWDISARHELLPGLGLSLAVINTSNSPRARYRGSKDRMDRTTLNFVTMNASLNGQF